MKIVSCGSRPTFLESSFLADHGGMLAFAPFHTCEEHGPVAAGSRKDAMDGDLGPISPICRIGAPAVSCGSPSTHSAQVCSAACCTVAAKEAARASVIAILIMDEGELLAAAR